MKRRMVSVILGILMVVSLLSGCSKGEKTTDTSKKDSTGDIKKEDAPVSKKEGTDTIELNYWTWFPNEEQLQETIAAFEKENSDIKINMTVMESGTYRDKVVLALSTGEDIDIIGVQPSPFAASVADYLVDLEEYMPSVLGDNWLGNYSKDLFDKGKPLTGGKAKFITILNSGSMFGFYNASLLEEIGKKVPTTIEEYKDVADALHQKYPDKLAGVFAGQESWVADEMLLTVLSQSGDYYNKFVYEKAPIDSQEYIDAFKGLKKFFDDGIFSMDIMDLNYASATEAFTNGDALVYYMGSWDAPLISSVLRKKNGVNLDEVGVMPLPVVKKGDKAAVRSYMDCGVGIVESSKKKAAAAKFIQYLSSGNGVAILAKQFAGTPGVPDFKMDESMLTSDVAKQGWNELIKLMNEAPADRNNMSAFAGAEEGPMVQSVINGSVTPEDAVKKLQAAWDNGDY